MCWELPNREGDKKRHPLHEAGFRREVFVRCPEPGRLLDMSWTTPRSPTWAGQTRGAAAKTPRQMCARASVALLHSNRSDSVERRQPKSAPLRASIVAASALAHNPSHTSASVHSEPEPISNAWAHSPKTSVYAYNSGGGDGGDEGDDDDGAGTTAARADEEVVGVLPLDGNVSVGLYAPADGQTAAPSTAGSISDGVV